MRTERLTILITREEKADIAAKAEQLGVTASELVRLAVDGFDVSATEQLLNSVAEQLERSVEEMNAIIDDTHDFVQRTLSEMRAERTAAEAERLEAA